MAAVSNTGVGFLSGSAGGDEDTLSLLYIPPALLCIPSQLLFIRQGNVQTPISSNTLSLSSVSSRDVMLCFSLLGRVRFPALVGRRG